MITIFVSDFNQFSQDFYDSLINSLQFHQLECSCGRSACMSIHGYYERGILLPDGIVSIRICRVRCSECSKTHALLPSSIVPYDRIPLADQCRIIAGFEDGADGNAVCEDSLTIDENAVKAVILRYRLFWLQRLLSEAISLHPLMELVKNCFSFYSRQFMQIRGTANKLFVMTT